MYQFIADFRAAQPLWKKIVRDFSQSNFEKILLVIWLGKNAKEEDFDKLVTEANHFGNDASKNILAINMSDKNFSPVMLKKGTHFITTREMTTLEALDYLWNTDVKIVSALDDDIFKA